MTTFDDRQTGFEAKFARDEETEFKVGARAARLLGAWAGERRGLSGEALDAYVRSVVVDDMKEAGQEDLVARVASDLKGAADEAEVRAKLASVTDEARAAVQAGS